MSKTLPAKTMSMLQELQSVDFAILELSLYLDTHPDHMEALARHTELAIQREELRIALEEKVGPLRLTDAAPEQKSWSWSEAPWPWQI
jgi:spore coat protein JB